MVRATPIPKILYSLVRTFGLMTWADLLGMLDAARCACVRFGVELVLKFAGFL
jgi:hypothetical protein